MREISLILAVLTLITINNILSAGWIRTYTNDDIDIDRSLVVTDDGGYVIVGSTRGLLTNARMLLLKTNANGEIVWMHDVDSLQGSYIQKPQTGDILLRVPKQGGLMLIPG